MGTRERRQREIVEREQLFLETARELIRQDGLLNLQMARLAEKCDYAVGTLYQHFASKEDLLVALATENVQHRVEMFERVAHWKASTRDRMFGIAVADMLLMRQLSGAFPPRPVRLYRGGLGRGLARAPPHGTRWQANRLAASSKASSAKPTTPRRSRPEGPQALRAFPGALGLVRRHAQIAHAEGLTEKYDVRDAYRLMLRHQQSLLNGLGWKPLFDASDEAALDAKDRKALPRGVP